MKICWLTDIHLNFLEKKQRIAFYKKIANKKCDAVFITGDIADAPSLINVLIEIVNQAKMPIYFVLGNHDLYHSEIANIKIEVRELCNKEKDLYWLSEIKSLHLNADTFLLGQDGWADGRYGDYQNSSVVLNDSRLIYDLFTQKILGKDKLLQKMQQLADVDAAALKKSLLEIPKTSAKKVFILTHVPPFDGACWHEGEISDINWRPFFTSKAMGDVIFKFAKENSKIKVIVLCGHTHSGGVYQSFDNLLVKTGKAEYYRPEIQDIIES